MYNIANALATAQYLLKDITDHQIHIHMSNILITISWGDLECVVQQCSKIMSKVIANQLVE